MFNTINIQLDKKRKEFSVSGFLGSRILNNIVKIIPKSKVKYLFIKINIMQLVIKDFFIFELYYLFKELIEQGSAYDVNMTAIEQVIEYIENEIWKVESINKSIDYNRIKERMTFEPLDYQKKAFEGYIDIRRKLGYRGYLLDAATGSGKTNISLSLAEGLHSDKIIIVCPLNTFEDVWVNSITDELYKIKQTLWTSKSKEPYNEERIVLLHYEYMRDFLKNVKIHGNNITFIVDEFHNFNELSSKRTNTLVEIINTIDPENLILMSGTTIKAKVTELIPMFKMLDKDFDSTIERRFIKIYRSPGGFFSRILPIRYKQMSYKIEKDEMDLPPLHTKYINVKLKDGDKYLLSKIKEDVRSFITKRKKEILNNMGKYKKDYETIYTKYKLLLIENNKISKKEFIEYEHEFGVICRAYERKQLMVYTETMLFVNNFEKSLMEFMTKDEKYRFKEAKTIIKYLALKLQGEALARVVMRARINCHKDIAYNIDYKKIIESTTKKSIIFSNYIEVCESSVNGLYTQGYKDPIMIFGKHTVNLNSSINKFTNSKKGNPLVATYNSVSTGVRLFVANVILVFDLPFRSYIYEQAIARAHRKGQDSPVWVYITELDTQGEPNINTRNIDIIKFFKDEVERITGHKVNVDLEKRENLNLSTEEYIFITKEQDNYFFTNKLSKIYDW